MLSATPSPTQNSNGPPSSVPPSGWLRTTSIGLLSEKHPSRSLAFAPISAPTISPSKLRCHSRHVPDPAPSKFTAVNVGGKPKIVPSNSVTTHWLFPPVFPDNVISSSAMLSATPSPTQNSNGPPSSVPPLTPASDAVTVISSISHTARGAPLPTKQ